METIQHRPGLPPMPERIRVLPIDARGYPVPWFVEWIGGVPDFRVMDDAKRMHAVRERLCWVCGHPIVGRYLTFTIGPMCAVNRVSAEPPSDRACAEFSAKACPFLTLPKAIRRDANLPDAKSMPGIMIPRNPGVALLWITKNYQPFRSFTDGGTLFRVGPPEKVEWYAEGRSATRAEVVASVDSGMVILRAVAREDGPIAETQLDAMYTDAAKLFPR